MLHAEVESRPDDADARRRLAFQLYREQRMPEAVEQFEAAARLAPAEAGLLELALAYGSVSRDAEALATYRQILELSPYHPMALIQVANNEFARGEIESATRSYRKALEARPDSLAANFRLAELLWDSGRTAEAHELYAAVLALEPSTPAEAEFYHDAVHRVAVIQTRQGEHEQAEALFVKLLEARPEHDAAHYSYAQLLLRMGRDEQAAEELGLHMDLLEDRGTNSQMATGD
jgi:tetratricopeptide (TPR) repeat protein